MKKFGDKQKIMNSLMKTEELNSVPNYPDSLNKAISTHDVSSIIKSLNSGKASASYYNY